LVGFDCLVQDELALRAGRDTATAVSRVKDLVIELDFVLEPLLTAEELLYTLFLGPVDRNFRLLRLEGPTLLVFHHGLYHRLFQS